MPSLVLSVPKISEVEYGKIQAVVDNCNQVVVLQIYEETIPKHNKTAIDELASVFEGLAFFIRADYNGQPNQNIEYSDRTYDLSGGSGKLHIFENSEKLTDDCTDDYNTPEGRQKTTGDMKKLIKKAIADGIARRQEIFSSNFP